MRKLRNKADAALTPAQRAKLEASFPAPVLGGAIASYDQHQRPPPAELQPDDVLLGGEQIHAFIVELFGPTISLSTVYYWSKKKWIPTFKLGGNLVASRRAIAQALAANAGLAA